MDKKKKIGRKKEKMCLWWEVWKGLPFVTRCFRVFSSSSYHGKILKPLNDWNLCFPSFSNSLLHLQLWLCLLSFYSLEFSAPYPWCHHWLDSSLQSLCSWEGKEVLQRSVTIPEHIICYLVGPEKTCFLNHSEEDLICTIFSSYVSSLHWEPAAARKVSVIPERGTFLSLLWECSSYHLKHLG